MEKSVVYDETQRAVIECNSPLIVAEAKAGAGKTTTAIGRAAARPNEDFLYICLNKAVQTEASRRFGRNVECRTTHSLAFGQFGRLVQDRVTPKWGVRLLADELGIAPRTAAVVRAALNEFFCTDDRLPGEEHVHAVAQQWLLDPGEVGHVVDAVRKAWSGMSDMRSHVSMPHDAYLKMWSLSRPKLRARNIILDEGQDTNPAVFSVLKHQRQANVLVLGDRHQSIYLFRGAKNAMEDFGGAPGAAVLQMPRTWRFGDRTAAIANEILGRLKGEETKIVGLGKDAERPRGGKIAFLSRTNSVLFGVAANRRGKGVHWIGGIGNYRIDLILDAYHLFAGNERAIVDPIMRRYSSWLQYKEEAEASKDAEARILIKIVDEFGHGIPGLVQEMKVNEVQAMDDADLVLSTAHKSKGLDFPYVVIGDDFECLYDAELELETYGKLTPTMAQEINLLYVAITRARFHVQLNEETRRWIEERGIVLPGERSIA